MSIWSPAETDFPPHTVPFWVHLDDDDDDDDNASYRVPQEIALESMLDVLDDHLSTLALLQAMYPLPSELVLSPLTTSFLSSPSTYPKPPNLKLTLTLLINDDQMLLLELQISLPCDSPSPELYTRQPSWLTRAAHDELQACIPPSSPDEGSAEHILSTIEILKSTASSILAQTPTRVTAPTPEIVGESSLERVWFWFPSLSSKGKRRDLVDYAPRFGLTGFVLAGKSLLSPSFISPLASSWCPSHAKLRFASTR